MGGGHRLRGRRQRQCLASGLHHVSLSLASFHFHVKPCLDQNHGAGLATNMNPTQVLGARTLLVAGSERVLRIY